MNIFILGKATGAYRTQNFIKYNIDYTNNHLYFDDFLYKPKSRIRFIQIILRKLYLISNVISSMFKLYISDVVYVSAMNHNNILLKFAILMKKKVLTEFYISFYDTSVNDRKLIDSKSRKANYLMKIDQRALTNSSIVIFLNECEAAYYTSTLGVDLKAINYSIVPLCINEKKAVGTPYYKKGLEYITLCWWGTYIPLHGLDKIIKAVQLLKEKGFPCKLYIFGDSDKKAEEYSTLIKSYGIEDSVYINNEYSFKNGKLEKFLIENCDIVLGTFGDSEKARTVIANKIIDGVAMQAPVITGFSRGLSEYFDGESDIFMINNTAEELANKVVDISVMDNKEIRKKINTAYRIYEEHFSEDSFNNKIQLLLSEFEENVWN